MSHLVIAPLLLPLLAGILLLLLRGMDLRWRRGLALAAVLGQLALALLLTRAVADGDILVYALGNWPAPFGICLVADRLAAWLLVTTALLALFALAYGSLGTDRAGRHFHVLFQLELFGLNGAFLTGDLFNLFVFFEVLLIASYGLLLHGGGRLRTRAALHYVVINLAGSALFLIAAGLFYGLLGTLNLADLAVQVAAVSPDRLPLVRAAGLLLFGVFALKAALVPLSLWLPGAYANTSAPVAALFAIMTKVGAYAILRLSTLVFGGALIIDWLLPLALLTLAVGMIGATGSDRLRAQVAYLVLASVGTLLTAFGLGSAAGIAAGLYYLPHSTFAAAALFLLADQIAGQRGDLADRLEPGPVLGRHWVLGVLFFLCAIAMAGLPPLSGFIGKFLILRAALDRPSAPWVLGVVLVGGLLALMALARSGSRLFYKTIDSAPAADTPTPPGAALGLVAGLLALGVAMTLWAGPLNDYTDAIARQLLHPAGYVQAVLGPRGGARP
ncbi:monovalent cation/H+ antiporter subunit D [uncultured Thiodictyon sp.]|uniref:monovalent cation/H+ antiporter subunit D n=1 Tax=uncultured Thiodictyon sp. TaxID=1846217 RepID=UPI0025E67992|nr:monovalent cation/H+ antiporter subunit D [uncultured Thiodictyon sp.]